VTTPVDVRLVERDTDDASHECTVLLVEV